ncbi:MAG: hypothetical protein NTX27_01970 [Verrucomicrobia bacterium]|nr:hypothetical protein [Verrucomicrobiota bacterium]
MTVIDPLLCPPALCADAHLIIMNDDQLTRIPAQSLREHVAHLAMKSA